MTLTPKDKEWIIDTIPKCFDEANRECVNEQDLIFLLRTFGWVYPGDDFDDHFLSRLFEEEQNYADYIVFWDNDEEEPRRFRLFRKYHLLNRNPEC